MSAVVDRAPWGALADPGLIRPGGLIAGEWVTPAAASFPVHDPATGELLGELPRMGQAETTAAIDAAAAAFEQWRVMPARERGHILTRWAALMEQHADDLARILSLEQGKPVPEARGELLYAASFLEWFAEEGRRAYGDVIPSASADQRIVVIKQPVGVVAGITPWNLPAAMVTRKVAPALAAGCTMVLKPAEQTPFIALAIAELGVRAGLPAGVLNVVVGDAEDAPAIGRELTSNPTVKKIGFTGSTEVGKLLMRQAADHVMGVSLELGGNSCFIVFDDADVEAAIDGLTQAKFRNAGQLCTGANRIFVHEAIHERFTEALVARAKALNVGHGVDPAVDMGPLIDDRAIEKVERHVADLVDRGSRVLLGGRPGARGHSFYEPTVISGVGPGSLVWQEETFGPVAAIASFASEEEVVALANDTQYGLVNYLYTHDMGRIWRVSEAIECGMIAINTGRVSGEMAPFGGVKESGLGREGSKYGLEEWLETKYLNMTGVAR